MKRCTSSKRNLKWIFYHNFLFIIFLLVWGGNVYSQGNKGQITSWYLEGTPYGAGRTETRESGIRWDVLYVNATGGHIQAKFWRIPKTECYAMADFKWTFSKDMTNVVQDERININFSVSAQRGFNCSIPIDPIFESLVLSEPFEKSIAGNISDEGKDLFAYGGNFRGGNGDRITAPGSNDVQIVVNDRSSTGGDLDARDGGFGFYMEWRGLTFKVYYKYSADSNTSDSGGVTSSDNPDENTDKGTISGVVIDRTTNNPIANANVSVNGAVPVRTNASGSYILDDVPAGMAAVTVSSSSHETLTQSVDLQADATKTIDFVMETVGSDVAITNKDCNAEGIYMYAEDRKGKQGTSVEMPVFICNVRDMANMDVSLNWNASIGTLQNVKKGSSNKAHMLQWNEVSKGNLKVSFAGSSGFNGSGSVAVLVFNLVGPDGSSTKVNGAISTANMSDGTRIPILGFAPGTLTISEPNLPGDCDGDDKLTERDALAALQIAVQKRQFDKCYDVNKDGKVDSQDARIIMRGIVGLPAS